MKILDRFIRTAGWALFLLVSTVVIFVLPQKPRSVGEFYAFLLQIDTFYLLLAMIGCLIVASVIALLGQQET
jgi:hypothetical protein